MLLLTFLYDLLLITILGPYTATVGAFAETEIDAIHRKLSSFPLLMGTISGESAGDIYGQSVTSSSDGMIIASGSDGHDSSRGNVRIFEWSGSSFVQKGSTLYGEATGEEFGRSVSLSSDGLILAVGASNSNGSGRVRVYEWNGSIYAQKGSSIDGDGGTDDSFGNAVAISSDGLILATGAPQYSVGNGYVYVFEWDGSSGCIQKGSKLVGAAFNDVFGQTVSLSSDGMILGVGAPYYDGSATSSGRAQVFEWNGSQYTQRGSNIDSEAADDESAWSISLSSDGSILAVGAWFNDGNGVNSGHVRVFEWNGSDYFQKGSDIDGESAGDQFGYSVSLSSDGLLLAAGARMNNGGATGSGHVRIYEWDGSSTYVQKGPDLDGIGTDDNFGTSVAMSGDGLIVCAGAIENWVGTGYVRVYQLSGFPTSQPSSQPSSVPSSCPSTQPSSKPTSQPSSKPTSQPTPAPTEEMRCLTTYNTIVALCANYTSEDINAYIDETSCYVRGNKQETCIVWPPRDYR